MKQCIVRSEGVRVKGRVLSEGEGVRVCVCSGGGAFWEW